MLASGLGQGLACPGMHESAAATSGDFFSKHRIEALSDGLFSVVMTLLVLEIKPALTPAGDDQAVQQTLWALIPSLLTFGLGFLISSIFWSLHHRKFQLLRHTNPKHSALTLAFLFAVTLLPISISVYLHAKASGLAQAVYFGNFTLIAIMLLASWLYARRAGLVDTGVSPGVSGKLTRRITMMTAIGATATIASYYHMAYFTLLMLPVALYLRRQEKAAQP